MTSDWRIEARAAIEDAIRQAARDGSDIQRAINASYPFGARENWPYAAWCSERRAALVRLGLIDAAPTDAHFKAVIERQRQIDAGQVELFGETA